MVDAVVIGAGPYGLSVAAHLRGLRMPFRVFGKPMMMWREHMPKGMVLKSEPFASNLSAPGDAFPLERFCAETGHPYAAVGMRTPLATLVEYGLEFQRRHVGGVEEAQVVSIRRASGGFDLHLDTGEQFRTSKVIVATGILGLKHIPDDLARLPPEKLSHSSAHHDLSGFRGRRVVVIGGGQSAFETAALLNEAGATVTVLTRRPAWWFDPEPEGERRPLADAWQRIRRPMFGLGPGWRTWFYSEMPHGYPFLPQRMRLARAYSSFGPAGSGWLRDRILGVVPVHSGALRSVGMRSGEVRLSVDASDGAIELPADHVIAATGYKADIRRVPFLEGLRGEIACAGGVPVLDQGFQSTAKGLHFVGFMSAGTFGPSMRFIYGTRFAARRVAGALARVGASRVGTNPVNSRLPA